LDVNPLTRSLQRRLQQRSVLYLMGPGRVLDRVRQMPALLAKLPRSLWDVVVRGKNADISLPENSAAAARNVPDFRAALEEQFAVVQSRIDDNLRSSAVAQRWLGQDAAAYEAAKMAPSQAGNIADEELAELRDWLEKRWNATPRDTALLMRLLRYLPGGNKLANWTEAAPYLLVLIVMATHHALFGGFDMVVLGGWSLATWITEKISNEVTNHTRATNRKIDMRFAELAHQQIARICEWIERQAPAAGDLDDIERQANELSEMLLNHEGAKARSKD